MAMMVAAALLAPGAAAAQTWEDYDYAHLAVRGVGIGFGAMGVSDVDPTITIETRADLGLLGPRVRVVPSIVFWASRLNSTEVDRLATQVRNICERQAVEACPDFNFGEIRLSDLAVNLDGHYLVPSPPIAQAYVGSGLGFHFLNGQGEAIDDTFVEDLLDTLAPSLNFLAGITSDLLKPISIYGEVRYVLIADVRHAEVSVGAMWSLPAPRSGGAAPGGES
jgi:hypothetical protein